MRRILVILVAVVLAVVTAPVAVAQQEHEDQDAPGQCTPPAKKVVESESWAQVRMAADRVWPLTKGSITVGVVDTGVSAEASALDGAVLRGSDLRGGPGNGDCYGRGTFIAGLIAARPGNGAFVGIAPGVDIYPVRITDNPPKIWDHAGLSRDIATGIRSAVDGGSRVIAVGLVATIGTKELRSAVQYARDNDVVVLAAATAAKNGQLAFPARYPEVLAIAPLAKNGPLTNIPYGADPELAAPGYDLVSIAPKGSGNRVGTGGQLAVGYAAGTAALVRSYHPMLSATQVADRLKKTADHPGDHLPHKYLGHGVVDPYAAVSMVMDVDSPSRVAVEPLGVPLPAEPDPEPGNRALWFGGIVGVIALLVAGPSVVAAKEKKRRRVGGS